MNRSLTIVFAFIGGLAGGLATRYIAPPTALAQNQAPVAKEIRAEKFTLVDGSGRTAGTFMVEQLPTPPDLPVTVIYPDTGQEVHPPSTVEIDRRPRRIMLVDRNGREIWSAGGVYLKPLSQNR